MVDKLKVLTKDGLEHYDENIKDYIADGYMINTTYADLLAKVQAGTLTPGQQYRITDYVTTTVQAHTQSAGHVFDIIVTADSATQLNENARAVLHDGDTYFASSDLAAWKLKYSINNDTAKYAWADSTNGKGVIWEMTDEFGNTCPYDFKNIQYEMLYVESTTTVATDLASTFSGCYEVNGTALLPPSKYFTVDITQSEWKYTFDRSGGTDFSIPSRAKTVCCGNYIAPYSDSGKAFLNFIVFMNTSNTAQCNYNIFLGQNYNIVFGTQCHSNYFRKGCHAMFFSGRCNGNDFGQSCEYNYFGSQSYDNTFGHNCDNNFIGKWCSFNHFGNRCTDNSMLTSCQSNWLSDGCEVNVFDDECKYNSFGGACTDNNLAAGTFAQEFKAVTA